MYLGLYQPRYIILYHILEMKSMGLVVFLDIYGFFIRMDGIGDRRFMGISWGKSQVALHLPKLSLAPCLAPLRLDQPEEWSSLSLWVRAQGHCGVWSGHGSWV
jgi:hypothetical protein